MLYLELELVLTPRTEAGVRLAPIIGEVSELVDEHDLGSCAERRPGSSPGFPTNRLETGASEQICFERPLK